MDYLQDYFETKNIMSLHRWVEENYDMFHHIVYKLMKSNNLYNQDKEELVSEAIIIFYDVVDKYDPTISQFSTFIYKFISNELLNKIKINQTHDFQRRVPTIDLDEVVHNDNGATALREETISITDPEEMITNVMVSELNDFVKTHLSPRKQEVYRLYCDGMNIPAIAKEMGVTKQYISKVLKDLIVQVRKEWNINEQY